MRTDHLKIDPEVAAALDAGGAVVALESTIIAHGLPWPRNLETAEALETAVRSAGAVPATVAVIGGMPRVGLGRAELERLARGEGVAKVSRRDLAWVATRELDGATTVAATMIVAHAAGIAVFATGGIGGVHRGAGESFDLSADLEELARTPVAVVCAGAKAILDLGATLEALETRGVPVVGYRCDHFPAFWARSSGHRLEMRVDDPGELARLVRTQRELGLGGMIVAQTAPASLALDEARMEEAIADALVAAERESVAGKTLTPFLLARVEEGTGGASLEANVALATANARLAAEIAVALARL